MQPQLATEIELKDVPRHLTDAKKVFEQKLDGHRILLEKVGGLIVATGRNGMPYGHELPYPITALRDQLPPGWLVDCELIMGKAWAFDAIPVGRPDLPLADRRRLLEALVSGVKSPALRLIPQAKTTDEKELLLKRIITNRHEGVIIKQADAPYTQGRSVAWLKAKLVSTIDVVVIAVRDDGKESMRLGLFDNGRLVDVGRASIIGKGDVDPGDVVEMKYLYAVDTSLKPRLVQPRMMRRRFDKDPIECTIDQMKFTDKTVMEAIA